jgi:hypothetical protein
MDFNSITEELELLISEWEQKLLNLNKETISDKRNSQNRSIKQILGHMTDSASNNHQRIVRIQYKDGVLKFPDYTARNDDWIAIQNFQDENWETLVNYWKYFNPHLIHVFKNVDAKKLDYYWIDSEETKITLSEMIEIYLWHFKLHLGEIQDLIEKE